MVPQACSSRTPAQTFQALGTKEVENGGTIPGVYQLKDWKADLCIKGCWSATVELHDDKQLTCPSTVNGLPGSRGGTIVA
jgi:hypothetical protein